MGTHREKLIRALREKAEFLGLDVSGLTDDELEVRLKENSKALASRAAAEVKKGAEKAVSRIAELRRSLSDNDDGL